mgnify:FL=1
MNSIIISTIDSAINESLEQIKYSSTVLRPTSILIDTLQRIPYSQLNIQINNQYQLHFRDAIFEMVKQMNEELEQIEEFRKVASEIQKQK